MNIMKRISLIAVSAVLLAGNVQADDAGKNYFDLMATGVKSDRDRAVDDGLSGASLRLGRAFSDRWNLELAGYGLDRSGDSNKAGSDLSQSSLGANALAVFNRGGAFQPYLLAGLGGVDSSYQDGRAGGGRNAYLDLGAGAIVPIFSNKGRLRLEALHRAEDNAGTAKDWILNIGFGVPFGKKAAAPVAVAAAAAPLDSDGDGVTDDIDQCPNTPAGAAVDEVGCELDSDGDGVVDSKDKCPGTPAGTEVDSDGCPIVVVINLEGVNFQVNSAELAAGAAAVLDAQAETLLANPDVVIVVAGHTDSTGAAEYNEMLSQKRAETVHDYLVNKGISDERTTPIGFGESEPIASNDTAEGRAENRRVELRIRED